MPRLGIDAVLIQLLFAVILMSFVVVTGFAGQLSLAQMAFGGVAAIVAAFLYARHGWPFPAAMAAGMLATTPWA